MQVEMTETDRKCEVCGENLWDEPGHSLGRLHAVCVKCKMCPDCEDGAV